MSDPNLQSAASSIRSAANDVKRRQNDMHAHTENDVRASEKRINDINQQLSQLEREASVQTDSTVRTQQLSVIAALHGEVDKLRQSINESRNREQQQSKTFDTQIDQYNNLANQVESMG